MISHLSGPPRELRPLLGCGRPPAQPGTQAGGPRGNGQGKRKWGRAVGAGARAGGDALLSHPPAPTAMLRQPAGQRRQTPSYCQRGSAPAPRRTHTLAATLSASCRLPPMLSSSASRYSTQQVLPLTMQRADRSSPELPRPGRGTGEGGVACSCGHGTGEACPLPLQTLPCLPQPCDNPRPAARLPSASRGQSCPGCLRKGQPRLNGRHGNTLNHE